MHFDQYMAACQVHFSVSLHLCIHDSQYYHYYYYYLVFHYSVFLGIGFCSLQVMSMYP